MSGSKRRSKKSKKRQAIPKSDNLTDKISHVVHGFPPDLQKAKGVQIQAQSGVRDINPPIMKGVQIHRGRKG